MHDQALIGEYDIELCDPACHRGASFWSAKAHLPRDVSEVMPYLNASLDRPFYDDDNKIMVWKDGGRKYALRPHELAVSLIFEREQASELVKKAVAMINEIWAGRESMEPDYSRRTPPRVLDILKLLPRTNCGDCGHPSCMAYAAALIEGESSLDDCVPLQHSEEVLQQLVELGI